VSTHQADVKQVEAFMKFVSEISDRATRKGFAKKGTGPTVTDIPPELLEALNAMSEDELAFLTRLKLHLDHAGLYDENSPRLYYL
jgi:hypothetical protein